MVTYPSTSPKHEAPFNAVATPYMGVDGVKTIDEAKALRLQTEQRIKEAINTDVIVPRNGQEYLSPAF